MITALSFSCRKPNYPINYPAQEPQKKEVIEVAAPASESQSRKTTIDLLPSAEPKREFRAAWVASVANIDWPSAKGLSSEEQKAEFIRILDHHKKLGINAVIVQIRAASDSFYGKSVEPWSEWLMGEQGVPPSPLYDPMDFMIEACHVRGIEFHAWFNLNRGKHKKGTSIMEGHITKTKPSWFLKYDGYELYNFGLPEVRAYIEDITLNVVKNYDVDGIHFDDYFYPYKVAGQVLEDQGTFLQYSRGFKDIRDWRRDNIDLIISSLSKSIYTEKKWVKFGVSPFCAWRNKSDDPDGSETRAGQPSYDYLFADTRKWAREGWVDYMAPQIYFTFEFDLVPYATMTDWWSKNVGKSHLYIGHGVYRVNAESKSPGWNDPNQIGRQIEYNRMLSKVTGSIFYNTNTLIGNKLGVRDSIAELYKTPALPPRMRWKDDIAPLAPQNLRLKNQRGNWILNWSGSSQKATDGDEDWMYVIYHFENEDYINLQDATKILGIVPKASNQYFAIPKSLNYFKGGVFVVTALDRLKNESEPSKALKWK